MKLKEEQRAEIRFCVRSGMSPSVTYARILAIHGQNALSKSSIFRWHKEFCDGRTQLKDFDHNPHPRKVTRAKVEEVRRTVLTDKRQSVAHVARQVGLSVGSTHKVLRKKLQMRKRAATWIPHLLTVPQKQRRVDCARRSLARLRARNRLFMSSQAMNRGSFVGTHNPNRTTCSG